MGAGVVGITVGTGLAVIGGGLVGPASAPFSSGKGKESVKVASAATSEMQR